MSTLDSVLMPLSILARTLIAGAFLACSGFIVRSLATRNGDDGLEVINHEVFRWLFMALFLGTAALSLVIGGHAQTNLSGQSGLLILLAAIVYLVGRGSIRRRPPSQPIQERKG